MKNFGIVFCLFISLTALAVTGGKVWRIPDSATIPKWGQVSTLGIADNAVTTPKINNAAVTTAKINDGAVTTAKIGNQEITPIKLADLIKGISSSSGNWSSGSASLVDVTNLSVTFTTTSRPVMLLLVPDGTSGSCLIGASRSGAGTRLGVIQFQRDGLNIGMSEVSHGSLDTYLPCGSFSAVDTPDAGSHTFKVQALSVTAGTVHVQWARLFAYQL